MLALMRCLGQAWCLMVSAVVVVVVPVVVVAADHRGGSPSCKRRCTRLPMRWQRGKLGLGQRRKQLLLPRRPGCSERQLGLQSSRNALLRSAWRQWLRVYQRGLLPAPNDAEVGRL